MNAKVTEFFKASGLTRFPKRWLGLHALIGDHMVINNGGKPEVLREKYLQLTPPEKEAVRGFLGELNSGVLVLHERIERLEEAVGALLQSKTDTAPPVVKPRATSKPKAPAKGKTDTEVGL